jgi:hypothetical protein
VTVNEHRERRGEDARHVRRVRLKLLDKLGAIERLGRFLRMFT